MSDFKVEFELLMKDMATKELAKFKQELANTTGASGAFNKNIGDGEKLLKNFYQQQRVQDRTMREATGALTGFTVGLAGMLATGSNASKGVQDFNRSVLAGVTSMQGAEFASASLGIAGRNLGGVFGKMANALSANAGLIGAVAGAGVALYSMAKAADVDYVALNKLKLESIDLKVKLGELTKEQQANAWNEELTKAEVALYKLKQGSIDWFRTLAMGMKTGIITTVDVVAVQQMQNEVDKLKDKVNGFYKEAVIENNKAAKQLASQGLVVEMKELNKHVLIVKKNIKNFEIPKTQIAELKYELVAAFDAGDKARILFMQSFSSGISAVSMQVGDDMYYAFDRAFGGANSLLEKFVANVFAAMAEMLAKQLAIAAVSGLLTVLTGGSYGAIAGLLGGAFHQGGTVPKAHSGDFTAQPAAREFPIMVRGGETVRTEGQERDLQNKGSKGTTVNININGKGLIPRDIQKAVQMGMRQTGLAVDKYFVNQRSKVVFT